MNLPKSLLVGKRDTGTPRHPCRTKKTCLAGCLTMAAEMTAADHPRWQDAGWSNLEQQGGPDARISPFALEMLPRNHSPSTRGVHRLPLHPSGCKLYREPFRTLKQRQGTIWEQDNLAPSSTLHNLTVVVTWKHPTENDWVAAASSEKKLPRIQLI